MGCSQAASIPFLFVCLLGPDGAEERSLRGLDDLRLRGGRGQGGVGTDKGGSPLAGDALPQFPPVVGGEGAFALPARQRRVPRGRGGAAGTALVLFARARLSTSFRNGNSFLYLAGVGTKKVPASSRNCCASISIWFQIKRTQPKVLANRTCCSDVGYARYFIALFSFCTGTAVTTFYYLVYSVRTLYLLKSVAIHPPHK